MPFVTEENLTDIVLQRWQNIPDPRLRQKCAPVETVTEEWAAGS